MTYFLLLLVVLWLAWKVFSWFMYTVMWTVDTFRGIGSWVKNRLDPQPVTEKCE